MRIGSVMIVLMLMIVRVTMIVAVLVAMSLVVRMGHVAMMVGSRTRRRMTRTNSLDMVVMAALRSPDLVLETENL